ncbi:hypothetical protein BJY04DRAFT_181622 [Aspergillus karnatakaensis]|uniref:uncharacterized protein n=1 Tax=Aspergillus karnatakaensis TaxID=1810916 RepID=UPI003CCE3629
MAIRNSTRPRGDDSPQPRDRADFHIAIICALPIEASAVEELFDKQYGTEIEKASGDSNAYSTGAIGSHDVVLAHMPGMGKVAAATAAACLRATFPEIQLALVVGICGGVPSSKQSKRDILLGDVVLSEGLVQYDFGRQYPDNRFLRKESPRDNLPRPRPELRSALAKLQTEPERVKIQGQTSKYLRNLQEKLSRALAYPGVLEDKLFQPDYPHKHHRSSQCDICAEYGTCDESIEKNCKDLACSERELVARGRQSVPFNPEVHVGLFASGDTVMKSGEIRDDIAARDGVIAFEMEGAGVWEAFPNVLVVKGVCDYADSHKNKKWQAYAAATAASTMKAFLCNWWIGFPRTKRPVEGIANDHKSLLLQSRQNKTLQKLYVCPYRDRKDRNPERIQGTCEWFTTHDLFQNWRNSDAARLLWVSADPGCGKSVLGRYLVDSCIPTSENRTTCYFFFKHDFEDQQTITGALCCILHQLFLQNRTLLSESIIEQFETKPTLTSSFSELWDILIRAAHNKHAGQLVCFLDALDECKEEGRSQLIQAVCKLYANESKCNIKFLLTSRPYSEIRRKFRALEQAVPVIHLSGENEKEMQKISKEIDIYVEARVMDVGRKMNLRDKEQKMLLRRLTRVPNRTYLWVYLTLDYIESSIDLDNAAIADITSQLPETVNDAYEKILSKSPDVAKTRKLLHIIVGAARPLTLNEMNVALSIKKSDTSVKDLDLRSTKRFQTLLRDLCGLFVMVVDSKIYLLHQTAREFLLRRRRIEQRSDLPAQRWQHSLVIEESDRILAEICMGYLLLTDFDTSSDPDPTMYTFLDYSAKRWTFHCQSPPLPQESTLESVLKLCNANSKRCRTWWKIYWEWRHDETPRRPTSLVVTSYFGFEMALKVILRTPGMNLRSKDDIHDGWYALEWAAVHGFEGIVKLLLRGPPMSLGKDLYFPRLKGVRVNEKNKSWQTPLSLAAKEGHEEVAKLLIGKGADLELKDMRGQTPLAWAAQKGHLGVVKSLVEAGAKLETTDIFDLTPLAHAAENEHPKVMKYLLDKGANIETEDDDQQTPLIWAAKMGDVEAINLLLDRGAFIETEDRFKQRPLSVAARRGHLNAVRLLLKRGADVEPSDRTGRSALKWATDGKHESVRQLLLDWSSGVSAEPFRFDVSPSDKPPRQSESGESSEGLGWR